MPAKQPWWIWINTSCEIITWWRHQMETFSALLALSAGNSPASGEFPAQRPVTRSFDVFFYLRMNKRLSKQSWGRWFEALSRSLWRHRNDERLHNHNKGKHNKTVCIFLGIYCTWHHQANTWIIYWWVKGATFPHTEMFVKQLVQDKKKK